MSFPHQYQQKIYQYLVILPRPTLYRIQMSKTYINVNYALYPVFLRIVAIKYDLKKRI